ncbi:nucleotide exchange factor GrpE [Psychromonas sp. PT13]|uniref:nucleotide exchange factor GrpE n=1 Tax=Psychromonas sp. PT13 TaxID=3439547 RepID=UPI003EB831B4
MSEDQNKTPEEQLENEQPENVEETAPENEAEATVETAQEIDMVAELSRKLAIAEQKIKDQQDSVIRAKAEMENVRRRATQDVEKAHKFALDKFAEGLLPVIDSMELAISHADQEDEALKPMIEGVELTLKSMLSTIEKFGLTPIDPVEQAFDPEKHQAMSMQVVEGVPANQVIAVMQKGYELNGRLIRPAMVMVSKAE